MSSPWPNFRTYLIALRISHLASRISWHYALLRTLSICLRLMPTPLTLFLLFQILFVKDNLFTMEASNVTFEPPNMYSNDTAERERIIKSVISQAQYFWWMVRHQRPLDQPITSSCYQVHLILILDHHSNKIIHSILLKISCFRSISGRNNYYRGLLSGGRTEKSSIVNWLPALMCKELANMGY